MKKVGQNDRLLWVALLADDCCRQKRVRVKILRNPTHGSGWMLQARPTKEAWTILSIPPTAVGGSFRASLRCGIEWRCLGRRAGYRLYLKHPPTAVGGISGAFAEHSL